MVSFALALMFWTWTWWILTRFGLLVLMMETLFNEWGNFALGADVTSWHFPPVAFVLLLLGALVLYGFRTSLGGRALFRDVLSE